MRIIRAILFDLGDTLWRTALTDPSPGPPAAVLQLEALLAAHGQLRLPNVAALVQALHEAGWQASAQAYATDLRSPDFAAITATVARDFGLSLSHAAARDVWVAANGGASLPWRVLLPGARDLLEELRRRGIALGIVTNRMLGGAALDGELSRYGLLRYFSVRIASCDAGRLKPHPAIFAAAAGALGAAADETAVVGDSLRADVAGARAAGMMAIWLRPARPLPEDRPGPAEPDDGPDFTIRELPELLDLPVSFEHRVTDAVAARGAGRG